jgi:hypothetical protein
MAYSPQSVSEGRLDQQELQNNGTLHNEWFCYGSLFIFHILILIFFPDDIFSLYLFLSLSLSPLLYFLVT